MRETGNHRKLAGFSLRVRLCLAALLLVLTAACGADFFPAYHRPATTPDQFTFQAQTGVAVGTPITSNAITVAGLTADSSPISVVSPSGSTASYAINGAAATSQAGTVKNGDQVTVILTSASAPGITGSATLTIGNVSGTFTVTTELVAPLVFSAPTLVGNLAQTFATVVSFDGVVNTHQISIRDSLNSGNAVYAIGDATGNPTAFTNLPETVAVLNGVRIFVRNVPSSATVTTLTIDGVNSNVTLTVP